MSRTINAKLRFEVFKRDDFKCQYCGASAPDVPLHVDHVNPVSKGGTNKIDNLITSCELCNLGKGDTFLHDYSILKRTPEQIFQLELIKLSWEIKSKFPKIASNEFIDWVNQLIENGLRIEEVRTIVEFSKSHNEFTEMLQSWDDYGYYNIDIDEFLSKYW